MINIPNIITVNKICDDVLQHIPRWQVNGTAVTIIDYQESSHNTYMYYDIVKGDEHANIKEVGFFPHGCEEGGQWLTNGAVW